MTATWSRTLSSSRLFLVFLIVKKKKELKLLQQHAMPLISIRTFSHMALKGSILLTVMIIYFFSNWITFNNTMQQQLSSMPMCKNISTFCRLHLPIKQFKHFSDSSTSQCNVILMHTDWNVIFFICESISYIFCNVHLDFCKANNLIWNSYAVFILQLV